MEEYISALDTSRFGFKVARINKFTDTPLETVRKCKQDGIKLVISRVMAGDIQLINQIEEVGFRLKDIQVTYNFDLEGKSLPESAEHNSKYRAAGPADTGSIARIAADSFRNYGHYSKNENIGMVDTSQIYEDWARRMCSGRNLSDHIIVAEVNSNVVGFLSLKILPESGMKYAAGVMGAVDERHRKAGIFMEINKASLLWAKKHGMKRVENNVLVTNYPVNKTYITLGFYIIRSEATFHCWLG